MTQTPNSTTYAQTQKAGKDFRTNPYRDSQWEIVSVTEAFARDFAPLELPVVEVSLMDPDPLFEEFTSKNRWSLEEAILKEQEEAEKASNQILPEDVVRKVEMEAAVSEAYESGRGAGVAEAEAKLRAEIDAEKKALREQFDKIGKSILDEAQKLFSKVENESVQFSLAVARQILAATAEVKPDYIIEVIRLGLSSVGVGHPLRIRVSPQDMEFIEVIGLPPDLSTGELGAQYVPDEDVRSGCVIETDFGEVDLQLDHMWEQVREQLLEVLK